MKISGIKLEENEEEWWKLWCTVYRRSWAVLYHNPELNEPIFNHATRIKPNRDVDRIIRKVTKWFNKRGVDSHIYITPFFRESDWEKKLHKIGYDFNDEMVTLLLSSESVTTPTRFKIVDIQKDDTEVWARTYCLAFYGNSRLLKPTLLATEGVSRDRRATLHAAMYHGKVVGVMALLENKNTLGLYCLGTVPDYRGRGVATELLLYAANRARKNDLYLLLQTFVKDGLVEFYRRRGFEVQYRKKVYSIFRR